MNSLRDLLLIRVINGVVLVFIGLLIAHDTKNLTWTRLVLLAAVLLVAGVGLELVWKAARGFGAKSEGFGFIAPVQKPSFISKLFLWLAAFGALALSFMGASGLFWYGQN